MRFPLLGSIIVISFPVVLTPAYGAAPNIDDYYEACLDMESTLNNAIQKRLCEQSMELIRNYDIATRVEVVEQEKIKYCAGQEAYLYGCDENGWIKSVVVLDALTLALCDHKHFDESIADKHYASIDGKVYSDGEPVVRCDTRQMNQEVPFFKLPPVSQEYEYPLENRGFVFDYIVKALSANQYRLFKHHLEKLDFADPINYEAIVYLLTEAAAKEQSEYFEALFANLNSYDNPNNYYRQPLGGVLQAGNVKAAKQFLSAGVSAKGAVSSRKSYLSIATENGDLALVKMLLAKGANVDGVELGIVKTGQELPLVNALKSRRFDMVDELLSNGAQVATTEQFDAGRYVLSAAIQSGSYVYFTKLHGMGAKPYDDFSQLLHYQLEGKDQQILQRLFELKITIKDRDRYDILRSLRDSLKDNYPGAVNALALAFNNGIDLPTDPRKGYQFARSTISLINRGIEYRKKFNAELDEAHKQMVMLVLKRLQDTNSESLVMVDGDNTLLISAAHNGLVEIVEMLIEVGVDTSVQYRGKTALDKARQMKENLTEAGTAPAALLREYDLVIDILKQVT